jgi:hypothetical protein
MHDNWTGRFVRWSAVAGLVLGACGSALALDWPNGAVAAVSLGYDDGLNSQLDHVVPALNKRGLDLKAGNQDFVAALKPHFMAYRSGAGEIKDMAALDPYAVPVVFVNDWTAEQMIALVERAAASKTMAVLLFHGVGAEHLQVSREAHDALLDYLARNRARLWTDSFVNIMEYVRSQQAVAKNKTAP